MEDAAVKNLAFLGFLREIISRESVRLNRLASMPKEFSAFTVRIAA
jgi:hypothetical protein